MVRHCHQAVDGARIFTCFALWSTPELRTRDLRINVSSLCASDVNPLAQVMPSDA
jgi:hypothetical protein